MQDVIVKNVTTRTWSHVITCSASGIMTKLSGALLTCTSTSLSGSEELEFINDGLLFYIDFHHFKTIPIFGSFFYY